MHIPQKDPNFFLQIDYYGYNKKKEFYTDSKSENNEILCFLVPMLTNLKQNVFFGFVSVGKAATFLLKCHSLCQIFLTFLAFHLGMHIYLVILILWRKGERWRGGLRGFECSSSIHIYVCTCKTLYIYLYINA